MSPWSFRKAPRKRESLLLKDPKKGTKDIQMKQSYSQDIQLVKKMP